MLTALSVRSIAVVEAVDLALGPGLTLLTGETGAGKSILIDALTLVTGGRAGADLVRAGADEGRVAAEFDIGARPDVAAFLAEHDLALHADDGARLVLRRSVSAAGKSRAWVNDRPVGATLLRELGAKLVDICGQHENTRLLDERRHLDLLDALGGTHAARAACAAAYERAAAAARERRRLRDEQARRAEREAFLRFQLDELAGVDLTVNEYAALETEIEVLTHAEKLARALHEAESALSGGDGSAAAALAEARRALEKAQRWVAEVGDVLARLDETRAALDGAGTALRALAKRARANPARLDDLIGRVEKVKRLCKKHGGDLATVLAKRAAMAEEAARFEGIDDALEGVETALREASAALATAAATLSAARRSTALRVGDEIEGRLKRLALTRARFAVSVTDDRAADAELPAGPGGADRVAFLFSANPDQPPKPLAKIASGGELARVMLAVKSVLAESDPVGTTVYDEVDTGIGGTTALRVRELIRAEAARRQVLCITHLPQIAAAADRHFVISKDVEGGRTAVRVTEVAGAARVAEIARMMGAAPDSAPGSAHAAAMIAEARA